MSFSSSVSGGSSAYSDWERVAKEFSNDDLQAHPNTDTVMSYFSDDATFSEPGRYSVGKTIASMAFRFL